MKQKVDIKPDFLRVQFKSIYERSKQHLESLEKIEKTSRQRDPRIVEAIVEAKAKIQRIRSEIEAIEIDQPFRKIEEYEDKVKKLNTALLEVSDAIKLPHVEMIKDAQIMRELLDGMAVSMKERIVRRLEAERIRRKGRDGRLSGVEKEAIAGKMIASFYMVQYVRSILESNRELIDKIVSGKFNLADMNEQDYKQLEIIITIMESMSPEGTVAIEISESVKRQMYVQELIFTDLPERTIKVPAELNQYNINPNPYQDQAIYKSEGEHFQIDGVTDRITTTLFKLFTSDFETGLAIEPGIEVRQWTSFEKELETNTSVYGNRLLPGVIEKRETEVQGRPIEDNPVARRSGANFFMQRTYNKILETHRLLIFRQQDAVTGEVTIRYDAVPRNPNTAKLVDKSSHSFSFVMEPPTIERNKVFNEGSPLLRKVETVETVERANLKVRRVSTAYDTLPGTRVETESGIKRREFEEYRGEELPIARDLFDVDVV